MPLPTFDHLFQTADSLPIPIPVVAAGGADPTVLAALRMASDRGWVRPMVAGVEKKIRATAEREGIDLEGFQILDADEPARVAVSECRTGRARLLMKGQIPTPDLMRAVLDADNGLRTGRAIGQVVLVELRRDDRRLLLTDTGISIRPTIEQKLDLLRNAVEVAHALGVAMPKVALVAASEKANPTMPETLEAAEIQRQVEAGAVPCCVVQGPLSFDLAYAAEAGDKKRISGPVVGAADALVFPDLSSANLTVKAIMYTADCRFGGVLRGMACPVVFMSRADTTETRLNSLAMVLRLIGDA